MICLPIILTIRILNHYRLKVTVTVLETGIPLGVTAKTDTLYIPCERTGMVMVLVE